MEINKSKTGAGFDFSGCDLCREDHSYKFSPVTVVVDSTDVYAGKRLCADCASGLVGHISWMSTCNRGESRDICFSRGPGLSHGCNACRAALRDKRKKLGLPAPSVAAFKNFQALSAYGITVGR